MYNPIAQNRSSVVRLPVSLDASFRVERVDDRKRAQLICSIIADSMHTNSMDVKYVLTFGTGVLPPIGAVAFRIVKEPDSAAGSDIPLLSKPMETSTIRRRQTGAHESIELSTGLVSAAFDVATGMLTGVSGGGVSQDTMNHTTRASTRSKLRGLHLSSYTPGQKLLPLIQSSMRQSLSKLRWAWTCTRHFKNHG